MEIKYIVAIIVCSLFFLMLSVYVIVWSRKRKLHKERMLEIEKMYTDKNLAKMDYDCAVYDAETEKLLEERKSASGQLTIDDVLAREVAEANDESVFQIVETEGMEEITGNYKPD